MRRRRLTTRRSTFARPRDFVSARCRSLRARGEHPETLRFAAAGGGFSFNLRLRASRCCHVDTDCGALLAMPLCGCTLINTHFMLMSEMPHGGSSDRGMEGSVDLCAGRLQLAAPRHGKAVERDDRGKSLTSRSPHPLRNAGNSPHGATEKLLLRTLELVPMNKLCNDTSQTGSEPSLGLRPPFAFGTQTVAVMYAPAASNVVFLTFGKGPVPPARDKCSSGTRFEPLIVTTTHVPCCAERGRMLEITGFAGRTHSPRSVTYRPFPPSPISIRRQDSLSVSAFSSSRFFGSKTWRRR
jgi:hypothetical protein